MGAPNESLKACSKCVNTKLFLDKYIKSQSDPWMLLCKSALLCVKGEEQFRPIQ